MARKYAQDQFSALYANLYIVQFWFKCNDQFGRSCTLHGRWTVWYERQTDRV